METKIKKRYGAPVCQPLSLQPVRILNLSDYKYGDLDEDVPPMFDMPSIDSLLEEL